VARAPLQLSPGCELRPDQDSTPYGPQDALKDAARAVKEAGYFPNIIALRERGYPRLASHIQVAHGGSVKRFCEAHDIEYKRAPGRPQRPS